MPSTWEGFELICYALGFGIFARLGWDMAGSMRGRLRKGSNLTVRKGTTDAGQSFEWVENADRQVVSVWKVEQ